MSTNNDSSPEFIKEGRLEAPFGRRIYDESVVKNIKRVGKYKAYGLSFVLIASFILIEVMPSERVLTFTAKPLEFLAKKSQVQVDGDKVTVPPLVMQLKRSSDRSASSSVRPAPIQIISFIGDTEIPPGAEAKAVLLTGATNGLIKARLSEPLKVDGASLLDAGVLLIGQGHSTEERLYIDFKRAVFKSGKSIPISAQAYDFSDSILGLKGSRVGDVALKLAASSGLNFLSGMAMGMQSSPYDANGRPRPLSAGEAAMGGVAQAASEQAKMYMDDIKNRAPIIEVKSGTTFIVTFDGGSQ